MTHDDLVRIAVRWLWRNRRCNVVLSEVGGGPEVPDAIGWRALKHSILVECKASHADYRRDALKPFRANPTLGMGRRRFYLAPQGMISPHSLPTGWGLLEVTSRGGVKVVVQSGEHEAHEAAERRLLFGELSLWTRGFRQTPTVDPKYGRPHSHPSREDGPGSTIAVRDDLAVADPARPLISHSRA